MVASEELVAGEDESFTRKTIGATVVSPRIEHTRKAVRKHLLRVSRAVYSFTLIPVGTTVWTFSGIAKNSFFGMRLVRVYFTYFNSDVLKCTPLSPVHEMASPHAWLQVYNTVHTSKEDSGTANHLW